MKQMQELTAQLKISGSIVSDTNGAQAANSSVPGNRSPVGSVGVGVTPAAPSVIQGATRIIPPGFHPSYLRTQSQTAFNSAVQTEYPMSREDVPVLPVLLYACDL